ncbi:MAG: hypothetical protein M3N21_06850 [Actinomycetota bacterium]|nr:hypothetical protein [Actinomycetota bacterium]
MVIRVAGGGCNTYDHTEVSAGDTLRLTALNRVPTATDIACTADFSGLPHGVTLPRVLRSGEHLAGECEVANGHAEAHACQVLKEMVQAGRQPPLGSHPPPPTEVK